VDGGKPFDEALREACIGRVRPKVMTAATAILGLLPLLVLRLHGTEIERPLAVVMVGGLLTSTAFTLLALPTFYSLVHHLRSDGRRGVRPLGRSNRTPDGAPGRSVRHHSGADTPSGLDRSVDPCRMPLTSSG